ncbi:MAG: carboxypeptidase regulatory-like domain-containing protein [Bryobacteraceae bacterium]|nr:carboxypeptidase regulatory-like domain-containing protein [Bryobacteraceae bacterium]
MATLFSPKVWVIALFCAAAGLNAQTTTAMLRGTVFDPTMAPVPQAEVKAANSATGFTRSVATNDAGDYVIADLPYGNYTVSVTKEGFQQLHRSGITLNVGQRLTLDLSLVVGEVAQSVTVTAEAPTLREADASLGQVIENKRIQEIPVVGRSFTHMLYTVPGAQFSPTGQYAANSFMSAGTAIGVGFNGMRAEMNEYQLDGTRLNDPVFGTPAFYPSIEMVQEFRVETQNFSSELSRVAGGHVLLSTKSGTNQFHGSVYEYLRNSVLEARNPFALRRPVTRSNQFGATLGGPIIRDSTFFFVGYEGFRAVTPGTNNTTVPTENDRQGILTDPTLHPKPIMDPMTGEPFPGNIIPSNRIDPIASNVLRITPTPNQPGFPNYTKNVPTTRPFDQINTRGDHYIRSVARLFGRWSYQPTDVMTPSFVTVDDNILRGSVQNVVIGFDANTPTFFNSLRFGHTRYGNYTRNTAPEGLTPQSLGFPLDQYQARPTSRFFGIPNFRIANYIGFDGMGQRPGTPGGSDFRHFEIGDTMTLVRGSHTLKWGGNYTRTIIIQLTSNNERGRYSFDGTYSGDAMADFLLGLPRDLSRTTQTANPIEHENHVYTHFGDTWKVRQGLTIDFGLAYSYNGQPYEVANRIQSFFVTNVNGVPRLEFVRGGDPRFPRSLMYRNALNFDPRLGIAWRPFGSQKTVIRIAAGRFHSLLTWNNRFNNAFGPPFQVEEGFQNPNPPIATLRRGFLPELITGESSTTSGAAAPMDFKDAAVTQWNFNIQREIGPGMLAQLGYVGNTAIHLDMLDYFNAAVPGPGPFAPRRPFPLDPGPIFYGETVGTSTYHAFRAQVEKRFSAGWTILGYYTFSKHLDMASALADGFGGQFFAQDPYNLAAEKGRASDDARHRFVTSYVWDLPFGRGRKFLAGAPRSADYVLGGWQLAGVVTLMSGMPISALEPTNRANTDSGARRPDRICDGNLGDARTLSRWFDTACYVPQPLYQHGNAGRNTIEGPGQVHLDLNVAKDFSIKEGVRLQFRSEFFNLTNTPYFGKPNTSVGGPTFGMITSLARGGTANTRIVQFALKVVF